MAVGLTSSVSSVAVQVRWSIKVAPILAASAKVQVTTSVVHVTEKVPCSVHAASDVAPSIRMTDNCLPPSSLKGKGAYSTLIKILKHVKV